LLTERASLGALSTGSLFEDSVLIADTTYESTIFIPLPTCVGADSAELRQDTSCPDVSTQTSLLLPSTASTTHTPRIPGNYRTVSYGAFFVLTLKLHLVGMICTQNF